MVSLYQEAWATLREAHRRPQKQLGQHFLVDESVIENILCLADLSFQDEVLEIGPGLGFVTRRLLESASQVWAVEIDPFLVERLRATLLPCTRLHLVQGDILNVPLQAFFDERKVKVVANLPYNISTPILFRLFSLRRYFSWLVLTVQQEVAERMVALPGSKAYGALSVAFQNYGRVLTRITIPPDAFFPRPKVMSTAVKIFLYGSPLIGDENEELFREVVRGAFGHRRKTLSNALAASLGVEKEALRQLLRRQEIDPRRRGETLNMEEFLRLTQALKRARRE